MNWIPSALKLIPLVIAAVQAVEKLTSAKKGREKQDAAIDLVGDLVPMLEASISREIVNEAEVQTALRKVIDATVALMNVVRDVNAKRHAAA